jgi:hypothetical protein
MTPWPKNKTKKYIIVKVQGSNDSFAKKKTINIVVMEVWVK